MASYTCVCASEFTGEQCELPRFELLGQFVGDDASAAELLSADGRVVVGSSWGSTRTRVFRWQDGQLANLGTLPENFKCAPTAMVPDASVVVGNCSDPTYVSFRWDGTMRELKPLPQHTEATAIAVSTDGNTVTGYSRGDLGKSIVQWVNEVASAVEIAPDKLIGASGDGSTILAEHYTERHQPYLWKQGAETLLPMLPGAADCMAEAFNQDLSVVFGHCVVDGAFHAVRWKDRQVQDLGEPSDKLLKVPNFEFQRASWSGTAAVGWAFDADASGSRVFMWNEEHGLRWIDLVLARAGIDTSYSSIYATAVSDDGLTLVGFVAYSEFDSRAFIARLK